MHLRDSTAESALVWCRSGQVTSFGVGAKVVNNKVLKLRLDRETEAPPIIIATVLW